MRLSDILPRLEGSAAKLCFQSDGAGEEEHTFDDLYRDVSSLVEGLRRLGVEPGMRIGLLAPSCYRWMVWDLAIMTVGCISVALAQENSNLAVEQMINRLALGLLAVDANWVPVEVFGLPNVVPVEASRFEADRMVRSFSSTGDDPQAHSLAFSSGTTGKTKGLIISRRGTERLLDLYEVAFGVQEGDRFLTFLPFANYQQRMAYYFCLYHGTDFVYVPYQRLFAGLKRYRPTYVIAPPVFYEATHSMALAGVSAGDDKSERHRRLSLRLRELLGGNIRYLVTGMAPIKRQTLDFFWEHGVSLYEAFGITEAGMVCWNKPGQVKLGSVGQPAEEGSVSLSEEGEVIVTRDALLALGYFDASDEDTRNTFVGPQSVATGDIARRDDDGFLTIIGRKKDAIITKAGEKFHPEPIELEIQTEPGVKTVVVLGGDPLPMIAAFVVVADKHNAEVTERIKTRIGEINEKLPQFQRMRQVVYTEEDFTVENGMRTRNLKLNRRAIQQAFLQANMSAGASHE